MVLADNKIERALVIVAHPDDVDFWAGGTIACWTDAGISVTYCVLSDGDSGGFDWAATAGGSGSDGGMFLEHPGEGGSWHCETDR